MVNPATVLKGTGRTGWSLFGVLRKHWYWIILMIVIIPTIFTSIQIAVETNNPTYPFFDLATRIFIADQALDRDVDLLRNNPSELIGMEKPDSGVWKTFKYNWFVWWRAIYPIISNVWFIFFPLVLIYHGIKGRNLSESYKNWTRAFIIFLVYLVVTNTIVFIHELAIGNTIINIPENISNFEAYYLLIIKLIPLHGLANLFVFLGQMLS